MGQKESKQIKTDQNGSNWIKMDQNGSNLIKLDFWWNNHWYRQIFNFQFNLIRLNQICPKWIKMDQTWSNLISDKIIIEIYHQIFNLIYFLMRLNQICPKWIKMDQVDQIGFLYHPWFTKASFGSSPQNQYKTYFFDMKLNL